MAGGSAEPAGVVRSPQQGAGHWLSLRSVHLGSCTGTPSLTPAGFESLPNVAKTLRRCPSGLLRSLVVDNVSFPTLRVPSPLPVTP